MSTPQGRLRSLAHIVAASEGYLEVSAISATLYVTRTVVAILLGDAISNFVSEIHLDSGWERGFLLLAFAALAMGLHQLISWAQELQKCHKRERDEERANLMHHSKRPRQKTDGRPRYANLGN